MSGPVGSAIEEEVQACRNEAADLLNRTAMLRARVSLLAEESKNGRFTSIAGWLSSAVGSFEGAVKELSA